MGVPATLGTGRQPFVTQIHPGKGGDRLMSTDKWLVVMAAIQALIALAALFAATG